MFCTFQSTTDLKHIKLIYKYFKICSYYKWYWYLEINWLVYSDFVSCGLAKVNTSRFIPRFLRTL